MTLRFIALLAGCSLLAGGCASTPEMVEFEPAPEMSLYEGFDQPVETLAVLGPVEADRTLFIRLKEMESSNTLGSTDAPRELQAVLAPASQVGIGAAIPAMFRGGVFSGSPGLVNLACASIRRVTDATLRRTNSLGQYEQACAALAAPGSGGNGDACLASRGSFVDAFRLLGKGDESGARKATAEGLRVRRTCSSARPLARTPVAPGSRGFMIVAALQALDAAPSTYLAREPPPRTAEAMNAAFVVGAKALRAEGR